MDITFCTFYFDIDRKNWKHFTVSNEMYMNWFSNLLSLDINLYILTENKFVDKVLAMRKKIDPELKKTVIKETTIEDLPAYELYNKRLEELMSSDEFQKIVHHKDVPEMTKPLYNVLMFNKVHYLQQVMDENPFDTEYFSWVDAGFIRDHNEVKNIKKWPDPKRLNMQKEKIKFFCINNEIERNMRDIKWHAMSQMRLLKGTIFFLHKDLIPFLKTEFDRRVNEVLDKKYIGSDEKIFDICCLNNREKFDLYKCNWREELKLFSYEFEEAKKIEYSVTVEWFENDIEKSEDYQFWFFCIEDDKHELIFRDDVQVHSEETYHQYKNFKKTYKITSDRKPEFFVVWPVSKTKGYLRYFRKATVYSPVG